VETIGNFVARRSRFHLQHPSGLLLKSTSYRLCPDVDESDNFLLLATSVHSRFTATYLSAVNFGKRFLLFPSAQTVRAAFTRLTGSAGKTDFGTLSER
jgi:hypothetical protein